MVNLIWFFSGMIVGGTVSFFVYCLLQLIKDSGEKDNDFVVRENGKSFFN